MSLNTKRLAVVLIISYFIAGLVTIMINDWVISMHGSRLIVTQIDVGEVAGFIVLVGFVGHFADEELGWVFRKVIEKYANHN